MKKIKYYIYIALGVLFVQYTFTACLNEDAKGQMTEEEALKDAVSIERNTVATLYNYIGGKTHTEGIQGTYRGIYDWNSMTTDEQMLPIRGGDWYDGGFWQRLYLHTWTAADDALYDTWNYIYKVIMLSNYSLLQIEKHKDLLTRTQYDTYTAEIKSLRAMFYFYAMDMWGRIPLVTSYNTSINNITQSERSVVFRFIIDELQTAIPYLSNERSNYEGTYYGRITKAVAYFLLAKLSLNAGIYADDNWTDGMALDGSNVTINVDGTDINAWQATIAYCDKIKDLGYMLESSYSKNFAVQNETSTENIFTIPMEKTLYSNMYFYIFRSVHYNHGSALSMDAENGTVVTLSTANKYGYGTNNVDPRWEMNVFADTVRVDGTVVTLDDGTPLVYRPLAVKLNLTGDEYETTAGARVFKYEIDGNAYSDGKLQANDIVLFRYADVLLMKAEAQVRNGEDGSTALNEVRSRVGLGVKVATLDNILDERLLELLWEGWRRNDLIRYGQFTSVYDLKTDVSNERDGHTIVFPIPEKVINHSNGRFTQNNGY